MSPLLSKLDAIAYDTRWAPRSGWHDDHRDHDGTPTYLPAVQQVRAEFFALAEVLEWHGVLSGHALQLGWGECGASHELLNSLFRRGVVTLDWKGFHRNSREPQAYGRVLDAKWTNPGGDIHSPSAIAFAAAAAANGPFDFLFCDAGHTYENVEQEYNTYAVPMVRKGGIIAFHDSLPREGYPEVEVWRFLAYLESQGVRVHRIGTEVGVAWVVK